MSNKLYEYFSPKRAQIQLEHVGSGSQKELYMSGIFVQAEQRNQNERIYPHDEIVRAVEAVKQKVSGEQSILGELDHPTELSINLDRVSHVITDMWMDGNDGHGKLKILPTPCGEIAKNILESGVNLGVSSRGSGNVDNNGYVSDFDMVTVDIVAQPSAPNAYPKSIYESLYNMKGGSQIMTIAEDSSHGIANADFHLAKAMKQFIDELKK